MTLSNKWITKALISLRGCAGWSAPVLFANLRRQVFSRRGPNGECIFQSLPFPFFGLLGGIFHFYSNFKRNFCKETVKNLIRRRFLRGLIWLCTVCRCPTKRTLGLYGLITIQQYIFEINAILLHMQTTIFICLKWKKIHNPYTFQIFITFS